MSTVAVDLPVPACVTHLAGNREEQGSSEISTMPPILFPVYTGTDEMGEIPRISAQDITPEEFEVQYVKRGMPVVLTGAMDEWPAYKQGSSRKWTFEFFKSEYGNEPCTVDTAGSKVDTTLGEYISKLHEYGRAALAKQQVPYLRTWYFSDDIPALVDDFEPPAHLHSTDAFLRLPEDLRPPFRWLFFGPAGTESKVHVDVWETDAWLGMLEGHKTFTLFHPAHRKYIEASHNEFPDLLRPPNAARFPQQSLAVPAQVLLGPGEILYIPRKWPHHAVAQTASISLTLNFAPAAAKAAVMEKVIPYARNRGRCQMLLGRTLRARDNLMQLCIHGGQIKYGDFKDAVKARNPMAGPGSDSDSGDEDDSSLASAEGE